MKAFPCEWKEIEHGEFFDATTGMKFTNRSITKSSAGMDLRDYFATYAMQAMLSRTDTDPNVDSTILSKNAFIIADAMMKARTTNKENDNGNKD